MDCGNKKVISIRFMNIIPVSVFFFQIAVMYRSIVSEFESAVGTLSVCVRLHAEHKLWS